MVKMKFLDRLILKFSPSTISMTNERMLYFRYLESMFDRIAAVPGDIMECGVGYGRTFLMLACLVYQDKANDQRALLGFDSFKGFPNPTIEDKSTRNPKKGEHRDTSVERIWKLLRGSGLPKEFLANRVRLVPGFFHESLRVFSERPIALLHIDADLYQSYREVLTRLFPKVSSGGVVLFDEYLDPQWPGATKAIDEYFQPTNYKIKRNDLVNKYFVDKS